MLYTSIVTLRQAKSIFLLCILNNNKYLAYLSFLSYSPISTTSLIKYYFTEFLLLYIIVM